MKPLKVFLSFMRLRAPRYEHTGDNENMTDENECEDERGGHFLCAVNDFMTGLQCPDCYGTGGLFDLALGIDDPCPTCGPEDMVPVRWPDSQRIMEHPTAVLCYDGNDESYYLVPASVWEQYKDTYYEAECQHLDYATDLDGDYCLCCGLREAEGDEE